MTASRTLSRSLSAPGMRPRGPRTIALVGADGAGKSTLTRALEDAALPRPVKRIYMGVNLESSGLMLPTTRLVLALKRRRGRRPDMTGPARSLPDLDDGSPPPTGWRSGLRAGARFTVWMLEEWFRQLVTVGYAARGYIVVFDRHFFADYYDADSPGPPARPRGSLTGRAHAWLLTHAYPRPALVICLDAPGQVLYARKPEASPEWLERRRQGYLALGAVVPTFVVVDASRRPDLVLNDVIETIRTHWKEGRT
jgi:thymidylate kinase